jgi:hypothetical protein
MVGRLDDWLKVLIEKEGISVDPGYVEWAGVAVFKKTYRLFRERGYRIRLLSAAFRNHMQWSELIGSDAIISPPYAWQKRFNASDIEVRPRIDDPVDPKVVDQLLTSPVHWSLQRPRCLGPRRDAPQPGPGLELPNVSIVPATTTRPGPRATDDQGWLMR